MNEPLRITLADAARFLEAQHIAYALIGGLAISVRGQARVTADVDLVLAADLERALALADVLDQSDFQPLFPNVKEVVETAFMLPLRHRRTGVKVDLAIGLSGFEKNAVARAERIELAGAVVPVATAEDLLLFKVLAGRPQDDQDLQGLVIAQAGRLDWDYCMAVGTALGNEIGQDLVGSIRILRGPGV